MKRYFLIIIILISASVAGFADIWDDEIALINEITRIMNEFSDEMDIATGPEQYKAACEKLSADMEAKSDELSKIMEAHPEWAYQPPPELALAMEKYMEAGQRFSLSLQKIMMYATSHMDDMEFQQAFGELNGVLGDM